MVGGGGIGPDPDRTWKQVHVLFFPFMAPGHVIPMVDMARLFASRVGARSTIVTTAGNLDKILPSIVNDTDIHVSLLRFHPTEAGLPEGAENLGDLLTHEDRVRFIVSLGGALREPFETLMRESTPDAVVTDNLLPWTADVAADLGVPRLMFHGSGFFPMCANRSSIMCLNLDEGTTISDDNFLVLPDLPHRIEMSTDQIAHPSSFTEPFWDLMKEALDSSRKTYGVVTNSFYDLEPNYADFYRDNMTVNKKNSWHIGPLSLYNTNRYDMFTRGGDGSSITNAKCLDWLDAKKPKSVVYVSFGSICIFVKKQLREIGRGLVSSGHHFLWVVRKSDVGDDDDDDLGLIDDDVEEEKRGLVLRGWAPQLPILNHKAIGAFVMHCGWNSCMECITAGVPMVTWPLYAEQFFNERLLVDVLMVGVPVGSKNFPLEEENRIVVTSEEIRKAVEVVMDGGDEAEERRKRVGELRRLAEKAVGVGGSSYNQLDDLLQNLKGLKEERNIMMKI